MQSAAVVRNTGRTQRGLRCSTLTLLRTADCGGKGPRIRKTKMYCLGSIAVTVGISLGIYYIKVL